MRDNAVRQGLTSSIVLDLQVSRGTQYTSTIAVDDVQKIQEDRVCLTLIHAFFSHFDRGEW